MNISRPWTWKILAAPVLALALATGGCGGGGSNGGSGGGGMTGTGSGGTTSGTGGKGSGGASAGTGGAASGGTTGSGGKVATGSGGTATGGNTGSGGATATGGKVGSGGASSGGATATGGAGTGSGGITATGGTATGGTGTASGGNGPGGGTASGGDHGSGGMGMTSGWQCPAASTFTGMSPFSGTTIAATHIMGAPPEDTFNNMGNNFTNVEGPVWIGDALYYSELATTNLPPARILKMTADDVSSVFIDMSGSNGLATDGTNIISANHGVQGIVKFSLPDKTATTLASMYDGKKFNSPNDLTVARDGTIYFTDPDYQDTAKPQGTTGVYQIKDGTVTSVTDYAALPDVNPSEPNGISLTLDETSLLVGGKAGLRRYAITGGAVSMTGTPFGPPEVTMTGVNTDGMTLDCAGNLYVAVANSLSLVVVKPDGTKLGTVTLATGMAATNVAFGGADHQTLYVTAQGANHTQGVYKAHLNIPGKPY